MTRARKITATISTVALLGAGGLGVVQSATAAKDSGSTSARPGGKRGGGPMSTAQLAAIAKTLGVTSAQLKAALDASKPAKPTSAKRKDGMAAALATALNVDVAKVAAILDANRPARPAAGTKPAKGTRPAKPDDAKLVTALATGLSIDEATVQAAFDTIEADHQADHTARETAMYAAVAKELGLSADAVQAAFEANRPAKPAT
jgi:hypothetical protein